MVFSLGVGVKMSLLLAMPGVLVLLWLVLPRGEVLVCGAVMVGVQVRFFSAMWFGDGGGEDGMGVAEETGEC